MSSPAWQQVGLLGLDIDGVLTDGTLLWAGPEVGFTQRFRVRDGEAIVELARRGLPVVPISRNKTLCARARVAHLGLDDRWVGVVDKARALEEVAAAFDVPLARICYVGDGREEVPLLTRVGIGCCPADAHPQARARADVVLAARGGEGVAEEVAESIMRARGWIEP